MTLCVCARAVLCCVLYFHSSINVDQTSRLFNHSSTALEHVAIDSSTALLKPHGCGDGAVAQDGAVGQEAYQAYPAGSESGNGMNHSAEGDTDS